MRLVGDPARPRLITIKSGIDHTEALEHMSTDRLEALTGVDLFGYVFKKDSSSCGIERVRIYNREGMPSRRGIGIFAQAFMKRFPLIPIEEEGRLCDPSLRENFIERVFSYRRYQDPLLKDPAARQAVVRSTPSTNICSSPTASFTIKDSDGSLVRRIAIVHETWR
jgi:hypothetical protein